MLSPDWPEVVDLIFNNSSFYSNFLELLYCNSIYITYGNT